MPCIWAPSTVAAEPIAPKAEAQQLAFSSPEEAVRALVDAVTTADTRRLTAILGKDAMKVYGTGDAIADEQAHQRFLAAYGESHQIVREGDSKAVVEVGKASWPLPIPLRRESNKWVFSTAEGVQEIINRHVGANELSAIQVCLAIVDAQREYAAEDRDSNGMLEYARKFTSSKGKRDGLYWEPAPGEPQSPLGPLVATARGEGYGAQPYHGYYYRILEAQGKAAPGGAYAYVRKGKMIGGFGLVAYPAKYGASGVMTFIVNQDGVVYEKDLGPATATVVKQMKRFDPDPTWQKAS
jgi:hypothetical protein